MLGVAWQTDEPKPLNTGAFSFLAPYILASSCNPERVGLMVIMMVAQIADDDKGNGYHQPLIRL